jgi:hypothetical protein
MGSNGIREVERVHQARCMIERMRGRLLQPTFSSLDSSAVDLNVAVECLRQLDVSLQSPIWQGPVRRAIELEVVALRYAVQSVEALLKAAGKFYAGLGRLMAPDEAPANYTAAGTEEPRPHVAAGNLMLHG